MLPLLDDFQISLPVIDALGLLWTVSSRVWSVFGDEKCIFSEGYFRVTLMKTAGAVFELVFISLLVVSSFVVISTLELVVGSLTTLKHRQPVFSNPNQIYLKKYSFALQTLTMIIKPNNYIYFLLPVAFP